MRNGWKDGCLPGGSESPAGGRRGGRSPMLKSHNPGKGAPHGTFADSGERSAPGVSLPFRLRGPIYLDNDPGGTSHGRGRGEVSRRRQHLDPKGDTNARPSRVSTARAWHPACCCPGWIGTQRPGSRFRSFRRSRTRPPPPRPAARTERALPRGDEAMRIYARTRLPDGRVTRMTLEPLGAGGSGAGSPDPEVGMSPGQEESPRSPDLWRILRALDQEAYERHF